MSATIERETDAFHAELTQLVRSAFTYLYDYAFLQNHPLANLVDVERDLDGVSRAQMLRRTLLDCLELLRPPDQDKCSSGPTRAYAILTYRYVDGLPMEEIGRRLGLSRRQVYREHRQGLEAIASQLQDKIAQENGSLLGRSPATSGTDRNGFETAQAEVERLRQTAHSERLNLRGILEGAIDLLAPLVQQTSIHIRVLPPGADASVVGDRIMLRQTFLNLLSCALTACPGGDLVATISAERDSLRVNIVGSPAHSNTAQPAPSPGQGNVGLAVSRALIEAQRGRLEVCLSDDRWQAQVLLPLSTRVSVLVIDDNAGLVALMQRYLGGHEVTVVGATEGEEALRLAAKLRPQVITLDVMMPGQDGWEILQRLKAGADTKDIPVVVCSVLNEPQLASAMGASGYITKPVRQDDLLQALRRWLGTPRPAAQ